MNNDLISRSALKIVIEQNQLANAKLSTYDVLKIIDNTPTVPLPDFKEGYKQAIRDGKTNFSRPQGKWIKTVMFGEKCLECDQCGKVDFNMRHYKFCPDCGAKMEEAEDD